MTTQAETLPFDGLSVGAKMESRYREITQDMINAFAELSGDRNPIHLDEGYASHTLFRGIVAHGALILSVATGLVAELGIAKLTAIFREFTSWKFVRPVRPGDSIAVRITLAGMEPLPRNQPGYLATFKAEIINQAEKVVQTGNWIVHINPHS
jgi:acyl dehydratase